MIPNLKWRVLGLPFTFFALVAAIDCSNSSSPVGCPQQLSDFDSNAACSSEGFTCPYASGDFDVNRSDTTGDCFSTDFIEYMCTQKNGW